MTPTRKITRVLHTRSATISIDGDIVTKKYHPSNKRLYNNECRWLRALDSTQFVPDILNFNNDDLTVRMKYCGEPITVSNAPLDWKQQLKLLVSKLIGADCHHGDLLPQNILVSNGSLKIIDFATAVSLEKKSNLKKRTFSDTYTVSRLHYLMNGFPENSEVHIFVVWSLDNIKEIENKLNERLQVIDKIVFSSRIYEDCCSSRKAWLKLFYDTPHLQGSAKAKEEFCGLVVCSHNPGYSPRKRVFTPESRIVNSEIFDIKSRLRSGREGHLHSSDNQEEARRNLYYLSYDKSSLPYSYYVKNRPAFCSFSDVVSALNRVANNKYVVLRRPSSQMLSGEDDFDILCDNYFAVKRALGGISYKTKSNKLFRNVGRPYEEGGFKVANRVDIGGKKIPFDIRYVGDKYYPRQWQERILKNRVQSEEGVYVCSPEDDFYCKAYHSLFHKLSLPEKYIQLFQPLLSGAQADKIEEELNEAVLRFLRENDYYVTRPNDITIPFNPPNRSNYAELRELYFVKRETKLGNYSGASKVLLNSFKLNCNHFRYIYWMTYILLNRTKADIQEILLKSRTVFKRKIRLASLKKKSQYSFAKLHQIWTGRNCPQISNGGKLFAIKRKNQL